MSVEIGPRARARARAFLLNLNSFLREKYFFFFLPVLPTLKKKKRMRGTMTIPSGDALYSNGGMIFNFRRDGIKKRGKKRNAVCTRHMLGGRSVTEATRPSCQ